MSRKRTPSSHSSDTSKSREQNLIYNFDEAFPFITTVDQNKICRNASALIMWESAENRLHNMDIFPRIHTVHNVGVCHIYIVKK
jgi:hypothetical protein